MSMLHTLLRDLRLPNAWLLALLVTLVLFYPLLDNSAAGRAGIAIFDLGILVFALRAASAKFAARFAHVERAAAERDVQLRALSMDELDELWQAAKTGTAKTGTAKTGTAKTGTAKTGIAKTGTAR